MEKKRLEGLLAVLTGGSGEIGKGVAKRLLDEGAEVIAIGRSLEKLEAMRDSLHSEKFHFFVMDSLDFDSILKGAESIRKQFGKIDILINNAGSAGSIETIDHIKFEDLQESLDSVLGFAWEITCTFLPQLNQGASIINVSTIFSKCEYFGRGSYTIPKAALNSLSKIMAEELGSIRVNTIFPGPVFNDRIEHVFKEMDLLKNASSGATEKEVAEKMLLKERHFITKEEVADLILYLGSPESKGISGGDFEIANGFQTPHDNTLEISVSSNPKIINLEDHYTWIIGGTEFEIASEMAQKFYDKGSSILLTFRDSETARKAATHYQDLLNFSVKLFDPTNSDDWKIMSRLFNQSGHFPDHVFILPHHSNEAMHKLYGDSVTHIPLEKIEDFMMSEIADAIIIAKFLSEIFSDSQFIFVSNGPDKHGNKFDKIRSAAIEQLIRMWRHETKKAFEIWQLIRYNYDQPDNLNFTVNLCLSISAKTTHATHINFSIAKVTTQPPFEFTFNQKYHKMLGNLDGKVALITGGSEGIGRETAHIMVQGGANVVIASRNLEKLNKTKKFLVKELTANGFPEAQSRIFTTTLDVSDPLSIEKAFNDLILTYGRIDYLINNAGVTGAEEMVFDIKLDSWRSTMQANLISNYDLMIRSIPYMKNGTIINISSAFGGGEFATPSYPIRSDYAVTKSGQRALAENFSALIGPVLKINTIAPGPVEGDRVRGTSNRPGLYYRRAKINMENKRINQIYNILIESKNIEETLKIICKNEIKTPFEIVTKSAFPCSSNTYLLTKPLAEKLLDRLILGKFLPKNYDKNLFFKDFVESKEEFFSHEELTKNAATIANRAIKMLSLGAMPTEYDVAREIVFNITSKSVSGETLYPSGGLDFDQLSIAGDFTLEFPEVLYGEIQAKTVMIVGNTMHNEMANIALNFAKAPHIKQVIFPGELEHAGKEKIIIRGQTSFEQLIEEFGPPDIVISFPLSPLPTELPTTSEFSELIENHITNHYKIIHRASLIDHCRIFFVTEPSTKKAPKPSIAFSRFLGATLAPLTVTAGQECFRIIHKASVYQVNSQPYSDKIAYQKRLCDTLLLLSLPQTIRPTTGHIVNIVSEL